MNTSSRTHLLPALQGFRNSPASHAGLKAKAKGSLRSVS